MQSIRTCIGIHKFHFIFDVTANLLHDWVLEAFGCEQRWNHEKEDIKVVVGGGYGSEFVNFDVVASMEGDHWTFRRADYLAEVNFDFSDARIEAHDALALKHAIMNLYSALVAHSEWGLLIHSSCIIDGAAAYLFSGRSGAGKSTIARLSAPRRVLSNEATIVGIDDHGVVVYNSFGFRSEPGLFASGSRSLRAIYLLRQAESISTSTVPSVEALSLLMDKVFYWKFDPHETSKVIRLLMKLVRHVSTYELFFQNNEKFWGAISG